MPSHAFTQNLTLPLARFDATRSTKAKRCTRRRPRKNPFPIRSESASACVMKRSAISFQNPACPHDRSPGIILPEGSDKFDKFQTGRGPTSLPFASSRLRVSRIARHRCVSLAKSWPHAKLRSRELSGFPPARERRGHSILWHPASPTLTNPAPAAKRGAFAGQCASPQPPEPQTR